jgi:hypothetical protein
MGRWSSVSSSQAPKAAVDRWENFYNRGYAGAWAWSLFQKTADKMAVDFARPGPSPQRHAGAVGPRNGGGEQPSQLRRRPRRPRCRRRPRPTPTQTLPTRARRRCRRPSRTPTAQPRNRPPPSRQIRRRRATSWTTVANASPSSLTGRQQVTANVSVTAPKSGSYWSMLSSTALGQKVYRSGTTASRSRPGRRGPGQLDAAGDAEVSGW